MYRRSLLLICPLVVLLSTTVHAQPDGQRKQREGFLIDQKTGQVYYAHVIADSVVMIREGLGTTEPALTLPKSIVQALMSEFEMISSTPEESAFEFRLEGQFVAFRFVRPLGAILLLLLALGLVMIVLIGLLLRRRRIKRERERQEQLREIQRILVEGQEEERRRLARELHDGPLQDLNGLRLLLSSRAGPLAPAGSPLSAEQADVEKDLQRVAREIRAICENLRPPALSHFGTGAALTNLVRRFREANPNIRLDLEIEEEEGPLPEHLSLTLFRLCQEALTNVARHSEASQVSVRLEVGEHLARLSVQDNGRGFQPPATWTQFGQMGHYGLLGMAERVELAGGTFSVTSEPERGTRVAVSLPTRSPLSTPSRIHRHVWKRQPSLPSFW